MHVSIKEWLQVASIRREEVLAEERAAACASELISQPCRIKSSHLATPGQARHGVRQRQHAGQWRSPCTVDVGTGIHPLTAAEGMAESKCTTDGVCRAKAFML